MMCFLYLDLVTANIYYCGVKPRAKISSPKSHGPTKANNEVNVEQSRRGSFDISNLPQAAPDASAWENSRTGSQNWTRQK
jgi:hypothetical protein